LSGVRDLDTVLNDLEFEIQERIAAQQAIVDLGRRGLSAAKLDEAQEVLKDRLDGARARCREELERLLDFPPRHIRHKDLLEDFWRDGTYEQSVFIMTKFPRTGVAAKAIDDELNAVIAAVKEAVTAAGFHPRLASDRDYHALLWDNVELYLLGCRRAIAIVEDKYLPELNPNVAMEWGFLRGSSKKVCFLLEQEFERLRADFNGLTKYNFAWADPKAGIGAAVSAFLRV
jgi:hypothetical protein